MKLFENKVGRPSNEILKKRRTVYFSIFGVVIVAVAAISMILIDSNSEKLKGEAETATNQTVSSDIEQTTLATSSTEEVTTTSEVTTTIPVTTTSSAVVTTNKNLENTKIEYSFGKNMYSYALVGTNSYRLVTNSFTSQKVKYTLTNNNENDIYYNFSYVSSDLKHTKRNIVYGKISKGENIKSTMNLKLSEKVFKSNDNLAVVYLRLFDNEQEFEAYTYNDYGSADSSVYFSSLTASYNLNLTKIDLTSDSKTTLYKHKLLYLNSKKDFYTVSEFGDVTLTFDIYNQYKGKRYYSFYSAKSNTLSKKTLEYKTDCTAIDSKSAVKIEPKVSITSDTPTKTVVLKVYNTKAACKADKYGTDDANTFNKHEVRVFYNGENTTAKESLTIKNLEITKNSVKFKATTGNDTIQKCEIYMQGKSKEILIARYPTAGKYKNKNSLTITRKALKRNTKYTIKCTDSVGSASSNFKTK